VGIGIDITDATQNRRVILRGVVAVEPDRLVASKAGVLVDRCGAETRIIEVAFGPRNEGTQMLCEPIQASEIQVASIHDIQSAGSKVRSSRMLTSCVLPSVMQIILGIEPRRSISVWILTAALCRRKVAHGNKVRHKSMVVESRAYTSRSN
jgi:hypothetical protein